MELRSHLDQGQQHDSFGRTVVIGKETGPEALISKPRSARPVHVESEAALGLDGSDEVHEVRMAGPAECRSR